MVRPPLPTETPAQRRARQARELQRLRAWAVALLVGVAVLMGVARLQGATGAWPWVAAFAEAAVVGALADWFAVVALFRRPLGLPIPHTAIVPRNKARVADSLAHFIRDRFLAPEALLRRLQEWQPVERLGRWLEAPERQAWLGAQLVKLIQGTVATADDDRMRHALGEIVRHQLAQADLGRLAAGVLALLQQSGRQSDLLTRVLQQLAQWTDEPAVHDAVAAGLIEVADKEYPRTLKAIGWVADTDGYSRRIAESLLHGARGWFEAVASNPEHPRRVWLEQMLTDVHARLREDEAWREGLRHWQARLLADPQTSVWLHALWDAFKLRLQQDLATPESALHRHVMDLAAGLAQTLARQPELRADLQRQLERGAVHVVDDLREGITAHIAETVRQWDERELVQTLELSVGRDLQYIRFNGTLVGGLIGLMLHAVEQWFLPLWRAW